MANVRSAATKIVGQQNQSGMYNYAKAFKDLASDILNECGYDIYTDAKRTYMNQRALSLLKENFIEQSYDPGAFTDVEALKEYKDDMSLQFDNDIRGLLESTATGEMNPVVGMSTVMHKFILMNMVYDKGAIQKLVTDDQKFTITQQYRYLIDTDGNKLDMALDQNKMTEAINNSNKTRIIEVPLPEQGETDFVKLMDGTSEHNLSIITEVIAVMIEGVNFKVGDVLPDEEGYITENGEIATEDTTKDVWFRVKMPFTPTYATNNFQRIVHRQIEFDIKNAEGNPTTIVDTISGSLDNNRIELFSLRKNITKVRIKTRLDSSNGLLPTCYPKWEEKTILEEIPDAIPINTTLTPDEIKDIASNYKIDQMAEVMDMIKTVMLNYKDDTIKNCLEESYNTLPAFAKQFAQFDYAPREGYAASHVDWVRDTFYWFFDSYITKLYQVYNDPNLTVSIFGSPDLVRKVTPTTVTYDSAASIGPVDLDFFKKVSTSDKRVYQWIGSDKLRGDNEFTILLNPTKDTKKITYRIIDYMMYIGNEIKNPKNSLIPSVHAYERWKFSEYQPVQGRLEILNPTGLRPDQSPDHKRDRSKYSL